MPYALDDVALVAEYPWRFGGSQRLLHILARMWNKPIYLLPPAEPSVIWDTAAQAGIPDEPVLLSIVVDAFRPRLVPGKRHIKFCHSARTIARYQDDARLADVQLLTHRQRVRDHYAALGLPIAYIPDGYIPYDVPRQPSSPPIRTPTCCITSRTSSDRIPSEFVQALTGMSAPVKILGNHEDDAHVAWVRTVVSESTQVEFVEPDLPEGVSEQRKIEEMLTCKVMLHYTPAGMRDVLEYSILDALATGNIPVCLTSDPAQLASLRDHGLGIVVARSADLEAAVTSALQDYDDHRTRGRTFLEGFLGNQHAIRKRWARSVSEVLSVL